MPDQPADALIDRLARGDIQAAGAFLMPMLLISATFVRRQLSDQLRSKFDPRTSFNLSGSRSSAGSGGRAGPVDDEARLRGLLATIARRRLLTRVFDFAPDVARRPAIGQSEAEAMPDNSIPPAASEWFRNYAELWDTMLELCRRNTTPSCCSAAKGCRWPRSPRAPGLHEGSVRRILRRLARQLALRAGTVAPAGTRSVKAHGRTAAGFRRPPRSLKKKKKPNLSDCQSAG